MFYFAFPPLFWQTLLVLSGKHNKSSFSSAWDSTISVLLAKGKAQHESFALQVYFCFSEL